MMGQALVLNTKYPFQRSSLLSKHFVLKKLSRTDLQYAHWNYTQRETFYNENYALEQAGL